MKKLLLSIIALSASVFASAQYDVGCTAILSPASDTTILVTAQPVPLVYVRQNFGIDIPATDTVKMNFRINGTSLGSTNRTPSLFASGDIDTAGVSFALGTLPVGSYQLCVYTSIASSVGNVDTNATNDTTCINFNISADVGVSAITIATPSSVADGDSIDLGTSIDGLTVGIQNFGTAAVPAGSRLPIFMAFNNDSITTVAITLNNALAAGASANVTIPRMQGADVLLPAMPTAAGSLAICVGTELNGDPGAPNNALCINLVVVDPNATGIQTAAGLDLDFFITDGNITLTGNENGKLQLSVLDLSGRLIQQSLIHSGSNQVVGLNQLQSGLYIFSVQNEEGESLTKKIFIQ